MLLIRYILIGLIVYLIVRSFIRHDINSAQNNKNKGDKIKLEGNKVSKNIGEYVDYEEIDEKSISN